MIFDEQPIDAPAEETEETDGDDAKESGEEAATGEESAEGGEE